MKENNQIKTIVIGHKNPDTDSVAGAVALAELRRQKGYQNITAACAGLPGVRTEYLFKKFNIPLPKTLSTVKPTVNDVINRNFSSISKGSSLMSAMTKLGEDHLQRIAVVDDSNKFCGMLSLLQLLNGFIDSDEKRHDFTNRHVRSSIKIISEVLEAEEINIVNDAEITDFSIYVAAMNIESFDDHIPQDKPEELAIVVGDRTDVHLKAINLKTRLIIVTGDKKFDELLLDAAKDRGVSILKTPFDSATVIRRLKFSSPVEMFGVKQIENPFKMDDNLSDIRRRVMANVEDLFPVVNDYNQLVGTFMKKDFELQSPVQLILVDHNEVGHGIAGVTEVPIVEIVDHHRLGLPATDEPIKINCDVVGSSCTLITEMFINERGDLTPQIAGILMGGIVTDTLMLRSPTTTARDELALNYLAQIANVEPMQLTEEIFNIGSLIAKSDPHALVTADKKDFEVENFNFSIAQIEEVSFEQFFKKEEKLLKECRKQRDEYNLDFFILLITNIVKEKSIMIIVGDDEVKKQLPYPKIKANLYNLPNVLSRKKQLLPQIINTIKKLKE
ncbi:putative manganese-dependent inorganic diphosphatase [Lentisphaerota bacterium WC36G]|nr:putative manganese-dependent inorganic diphosphatase [Lentisphaerae bacterium WC36]